MSSIFHGSFFGSPSPYLHPVDDDREDTLTYNASCAKLHLHVGHPWTDDLTDQVLHPLVERPNLFLHDLLEKPRRVCKLLLHDHELLVILIGNPGEKRRHLPGQPLAGAGTRIHPAAGWMGLEGFTERMAPSLPVEGLLIAKVIIYGGNVRAGPDADIHDGRIAVALFRENIACRREKTLAGPRGVLSRDLHLKPPHYLE